MAHSHVTYALVLLLAARAPFSSFQGDETLEHRAAPLAARMLEEQDLAGLSLVVSIGQDVLYEAGWGYADPGEGLAATPDSLYRAGALTPQFVTVLLLDLEEDGELDLDDGVTKHLTELELGEDEPTISDLLAHTSGLPGYAPAFPATRTPFDTPAVLAWLAKEPRLAAPGSCFAYSETNDLLAGLVAERITGRTVRELVEARIFDACDMEDSVYSWEGPAVHSQSDTTRALGGELLSLGTFAQPFEAEALCSTASDVAHFQRSLVAGELIGAHALERMQRATRLDDGAEVSYGYGIHRRALDGRMGISYGGGLAGAHVSVTHYPEVDLTVVLLAHGEDARFESLERHVSRLLMDGPEPELLDLALEDDEAERYVGTFVLGCVHLSVEHHDGHLVLLPHMGARRSLLRQAEHVFAAADEPGVTVTFLLEDDRIVALVLDEHGARIEARRQ